MSNRNPLFGLLLLAAVAEHAKKNDLPFGKSPNMDGPKPIERKPLSRKLECPDCGQEVLLVRSVTDGKPCLDLHFLMDDGEHMVAGMLFANAEERDGCFQRMTYKDANAVFGDMMLASSGSFGLADLPVAVNWLSTTRG